MVSKRVLGVLGGGQLGQMMQEEAVHLGIKVICLDPTPGCPAGLAGAEQIVGKFNEADDVKKLAAKVDVITAEIEHIDTHAMEAAEGSAVCEPSPATIRMIQDKYLQKEYFAKHGIALAEYVSVESDSDIKAAADKFGGFPIMLKSRKNAYDGKGNAVVNSAADIASCMGALPANGGLYVEKMVPFQKELAVMVVRSRDGTVCSYPVVETIHENNICSVVIAPAQNVAGSVRKEARELAERTVACLTGAGVFGVEMFVNEDGSLLVNEVAPRPHNSGHYTIEACGTSQFENHVRAVMDLPLGSTELVVGASAMVNLLGLESDERTQEVLKACLDITNCRIHWYGKGQSRKGRKMGHFTVTAQDAGELMKNINEFLDKMKLTPLPALSSKPSPLVGIIMGSDSDLPKMSAAADILKSFGVPFEVTIVSAHRTPDRLVNYARSARGRGLQCIIAGAGGAAHLPGMVASMTSLPVIGVPVALKYLDGVDSLHSIVQMPRGVPVATVAIDNSTNAGLLAARIVGAHVDRIADAMEAYQENMKNVVLEKASRLEQGGYENYKMP
eukprot:Clim_evm4s237 gene=Clim_evmTU4s237